MWVVGAMILFFIGNRIGLIIQHHLALGTHFVLAILNGVLDFFKSFSSDYLGWKIGFGTIPLISSFAIFALVGLIGYWRNSNRTNYKVGEEHGSARYGNIENEGFSISG